jgi:hypothetical protein
MLVLRFAAVLALAIWLGGLVMFGSLAAPAVFSVVTSQNVVDGRTLAGAIVGEILERFHYLAYACGGLLLLSLIARRILGPRPRRFGLRLALGTLMGAATVYSGFVILPAIAQVRREIGPGVAVSSLPAEDPRRTTFDGLHERSRLVQLIPLAGACALLFFELSERDRDRSWPH